MRAYFLWLAKFLTKVVVLTFVLFAIVGAFRALSEIDEAKLAGETGKRHVALLKLEGMITDEQEFLSRLRQELRKDQVIGAVVQINSPGGPVGPSQEIYEELARLTERKPIVVSMGTVAASGGLYASLGASRVFAQPGTLTGSVGVILSIPNFEKLAERFGVGMTVIKSGELKDAGNAFRSMTEEERQYFTRLADTAHERFVQDIVAARSLDMDVVRSFADGRILLGEEAQRLGLIDELGGLQDAARAVYALGGVDLADDEDPEIRFRRDRFEEFRRFFETRVSSWIVGQRHTALYFLMP